MLTQAQIEERKTGIGASEAAAILGLSRYSTAWKVWARKQNIAGHQADSWDIRRGHAMEPAILDWYARKMGVKLEYPGTVRHASIPCILATPDAVAVRGSRWLVECKAPSSRTRSSWGEPGTDHIDPEYYPQVIIQMAVMGLDRVDVVASIAGEEPLIYQVSRDQELERMVLDRLCAWWDRHMVGDAHPAMDGSREASAWIEERFKRPEKPLLKATEELDSLALALAEARQKQADAEGQKAEIENKFRAVIADQEGIEGEGWRITWRATRAGKRVLRFVWQEESK